LRGHWGTFSREGSSVQGNGRETAREKKLEEKITRQQEVIACLTEENLKSKKTDGEA
jgi:hypothetical protein